MRTSLERNTLCIMKHISLYARRGAILLSVLVLVFAANSAKADVAPAKYGDSGNNVFAIQTILNQRGFLSVEPNGQFGPKTRAAILAFQKANGIEAIGLVGPKTLVALAKSATPSTTTSAETHITPLPDPNVGGGTGTITDNTLCAPVAVPWVHLLAPNVGVTFGPGGSISVKWASCNQGAGVASMALVDQRTGYNIYVTCASPVRSGPVAIGDNQCSFPIPSNITEGNYRLRFFCERPGGNIYCVDREHSEDISENNFKILTPAPVLGTTTLPSDTILANPGTLSNGITPIVSTFTVTKNTAYLDQTVVAGTKHVKIGSYLLKNNDTAEAVSLTFLKVTLDNSVAPLSDVTSFSVTNNGTAIGEMPVFIEKSPSVPLRGSIAPGATVTLDLYADLGSANYTGTITTGISVSGIGMVHKVAHASGSSVGGQIITLSKLVLSTGDMLISKNQIFSDQTISPNAMRQELAAFIVQNTSTEAIVINSMHVFPTKGTLNHSDLKNMTVMMNGSQVGAVFATPSADNALFTSVLVPPGGMVPVYVFADIGAGTGTLQTSVLISGNGTNSGNIYPLGSMTSGVIATVGQLLTVKTPDSATIGTTVIGTIGAGTGTLGTGNQIPAWVSGVVTAISGNSVSLNGTPTSLETFYFGGVPSGAGIYTVDTTRARFTDHGMVGTTIPAVLTIADLKVGDMIAVQGSVSGMNILATVVENGSLDGRAVWGGRVTMKGDSGFVYDGNDGITYVVATSPTTILDGRTVISVGDTVYVYGTSFLRTIWAKSIHDDGPYSISRG